MADKCGQLDIWRTFVSLLNLTQSQQALALALAISLLQGLVGRGKANLGEYDASGKTADHANQRIHPPSKSTEILNFLSGLILSIFAVLCP